ncbi:MAG: hypothetical protein LN412_04215 [Candidatus Thermoplasmatota archaeon]|nr:hypothetical protein [Candidatus Thermoplasmatota archaeon]
MSFKERIRRWRLERMNATRINALEEEVVTLTEGIAHLHVGAHKIRLTLQKLHGKMAPPRSTPPVTPLAPPPAPPNMQIGDEDLLRAAMEEIAAGNQPPSAQDEVYIPLEPDEDED